MLSKLFVYSNLNFNRLEEEGYKPPENLLSLPASDASPAPVIETITLAELSQKTATDNLKVIIYNYMY